MERFKLHRFWFNYDNKIKYRTNNQIELFHRSLNQLIENSHPKISYLLQKLKLIIVNKYNEYLVYDNKNNNEKISKYDLFKDMYNFTVKFSQKYNMNFDLKILMQAENTLNEELNKICNKILDEIFDVAFSENEEEDDDDDNEKIEEDEEEKDNDNLISNNDNEISE